MIFTYLPKHFIIAMKSEEREARENENDKIDSIFNDDDDGNCI